MGRYADPLEMKLLKGTVNGTKERRRNEIRPEALDNIPPAPPELSPAAADLWDRVAAHLHSFGLLMPSVLEYMLAYCRAYELREMAWQSVREEGLYQVGRRGAIERAAALKVHGQQVDKMVEIGMKMGLSPADRSKLGAASFSRTADRNSTRRIGING